MQTLLAALLALSSPLAWAASPPPDIKWSFGANLDLQGQYFPANVSPNVNQAFGIMNGDASASVKVGHNFLAKLRPSGHWDPLNPSPADQAWYDVPEGYLQFKGSLAEGTVGTLQVGMNTFTWGVTDGYNPVDVVSARRYTDPLNPEKLGAFSALGRLDFGAVLLEGLYIPWQRQSTLPGGQSRWLPRELGGQINQGGIIFVPPTTPDYYFLVPRAYDAALQNNWGGRLSAHVIGLDAAAYYFDGAASVPGTGLSLNGNAVINPTTFTLSQILSYPQIGILPIYYRIKMEGASLVLPVWELVVRGELARTIGVEQNNGNLIQSDTEFVGEVEHTFSGETSSLTAIGLVSWADPQYGGNDPNATTTNTPGLLQLFDNAVGLGLRWQPTEMVSGEGYAAFDLKHGGDLLKASLSYKLSDAWKIYGGGELFQGDITVPIGVYRKNSRIIAGVHLSL